MGKSALISSLPFMTFLAMQSFRLIGTHRYTPGEFSAGKVNFGSCSGVANSTDDPITNYFVGERAKGACFCESSKRRDIRVK